MLRLVTYLSPSIPLGLYEAIAAHLRRTLAMPVELASDERRSGPMPGSDNPFADGRADVGFVCAPSYVALAAESPASVALLGVAPVHDDPRNGDAPVYHADVIVAASSPARSLADLRGARFAYNDESSLSGYHGVLRAVARREHFGSWIHSGSHLASIELVASGGADGAAIDANALRAHAALASARAVQVIETLGPYAVQPIIVRRDLPARLAMAARDALARMHATHADELARFGVRRFAEVDDSHYDAERKMMPGTC